MARIVIIFALFTKAEKVVKYYKDNAGIRNKLMKILFDSKLLYLMSLVYIRK